MFQPCLIEDKSPLTGDRPLAGGQFIDVAALEFTASTDVNESLTMAYKDAIVGTTG